LNLRKNLLLKNEEITALFVSSHLFAMHVIDACKELNKKIGKDISLISFDSNILSFLAPNITVVSQVANETNEHFIKIINSKINNLLKKTRDKIKLRGSIVNEITTKGDFIKKIRDSIDVNLKNKYLIEVVSLKDSKTAESIIVELNVTQL